MNQNAIAVLICVLALFTRANAIAYGWGKNDQGQLGMGSTQGTTWQPTLIPFYNSIPLLNCLTATNYHICLAQNGSAWGSGLQFYGQFANGYTSTSPIYTPIACPSLNSSLDIALAGMACNANMNTNLLGWGNLAGYVQGKTTGSTPKIQTALSSYKFDAKVVAVNTVMEGTLVRLSNNTLWVAGNPGSGRLGNNATATLYNFIENTFWRSISIKQIFSSQSAHACALANNGSLYCWGQNTYGQLGVGDAVNRLVPTRVSFFETNHFQVYKVSYGDSHTAVLTCGGKIFTFGAHNFGQLGTTATVDSSPHPIPTEVVDTRWQGTAVDVVTGVYQTFIRTSGNMWYVWGSSNYGALGLGQNTNNQATPVYNSYFDGLNKIKSSSQSLNFFGWYDDSVTNDKPGCNLVNECAVGTAACDKNAVCSDLEIGYSCTCRPGWVGDGFSTGTGCQDAYSCEAIGDECVGLATCDDSTGFAQCICPTGYQGDGRINNATVNGTGCTDINECTTGTPCGLNAYCTNLVPNYNCSCDPGYFGDAYSIFGCVIECQPGQYSKGVNSCEECPLGTYSDTYQAGYCLPCPPGTYADVTGTNSSSNCKKCPTGGYSSYGARFCGLCDYGYTNDPTQYYSDNSTCFGCPLGTYGYYGQCYPCAVGQYSVDAVAKQCLYCQPGYYNTQQASLSCIKCPAGYISKGGSSTCTICPAGYYSTAGSKECLKCAPGTSTNGNPGQSSCTACNPGFYTAKAASSTCSPCGNGFYTNSSGNANCLRCPQGTYSVGTASTFCTSCASGSFVGATGSTQCFSCSTGSVVSDGINCIPCNAGTYYDSTTATCQPCAPGTFVAVTGATSCYSCSAGYYADASGALVCKKCDVNTYSAAGASACTPCPTGKHSAGAASVCS